MKYRKFNKYEKKEVRAEMLAQAMHGDGLYLFENKSNADLTLPRPTKSGIRKVGPRGQFQGDSYYLQLVRTGFLRLIKELQSPEQEKTIMEEKLILDQPDRITSEGTIEQVVKGKPKQRLNEGDNDPQQDVLLNESPSGFVIVE